MIISLPYPVSNNRNARMVNGRIVSSREAKQYKTEAAWLAKAAGCKPTQGKLSVTVLLHPKMTKDGKANKQLQDLDNVCKVAFDALNGVAWFDDSQIVRLLAEVAGPVVNGGLTIKIEDC